MELYANDVVLVDATDDGAIPQGPATNLIGVPVPLDDEKVIAYEGSSGDFGIRRSKRLDFAEVEKAAKHIGDTQVWYLSWTGLAGTADLKAPLYISGITNS